jgi:O-Antigen ligase
MRPAVPGAARTMLMAIPILTIAGVGLLLWIAASPLRVLYLLPVLLAFEYRVRPGIFSMDLAELCVVVALGVWLIRRWEQAASDPLQERSRETILILALAVCAAPSILFESDMAHAASVYRDLLVPFLFFFLLMQCRLERKQVHALIKLACALALANACLGILQYATGNYLWFAGAGEAEWQEYKIGLARLSILGESLAPGNALPIGMYTGANNFASFLSLPLCVSTTLAFTREIGRRRRIFCLAASLLLFVCLLLTIFRSGLVVFAASMTLVFLLLHSEKKIARVAAVAGLLALLGFLFLTQGILDWDQFGSFQGREEMVSAAVRLIKAHPEVLLTGGFSDLYRAQSRETQEIHNLALYSVVHYGLPATIVLFAFFLLFFQRAVKAARNMHGPERNVLIAVCASVTASVFLYGATTMVIDSVQTSIWMLFWVGMGGYLIALQKYSYGTGPQTTALRVIALPAQGEPA